MTVCSLDTCCRKTGQGPLNWIRNWSFSCFAAEKVFSNASLMMIMTMPMHYSIFFNQSSKVSPHKSRRNRHNPVTLDTKIGKDLVLLVLPCLALTGKYIMESIQWEGFLCQNDQSEYWETSTLAHSLKWLSVRSLPAVSLSLCWSTHSLSLIPWESNKSDPL